MDASIDAGDEVELPGPPLHLPEAEPGEDNGENRQQSEKRDPPPAPLRGDGGRCGHRPPHIGWSPGAIGIMLLLRWYITHSEPASMITTMTTVKISAIIDHPPSERVFMCRK